MAGVDRCSEMRGEDGRFLPAREAYADGCRCAVCDGLHGGDNPADRPRAEDGKFKSTALSRSVRSAVAEAGGDEVLYGYVEAGLSASEILETLGLERSERGTYVVYRILNSDPERYEEAKRISADAHAERAGEIFEMYGEKPDGSLTSAQAKLMADKANWHKWLAELRAGRMRGGVEVNVDVGQLHLDALRQVGSRKSAQRSEPVEADYEIEEGVST